MSLQITLSEVTSAGKRILPSTGGQVMCVGPLVRIESSTGDLVCGMDGAVLELYHGLVGGHDSGLCVIYFQGYPERTHELQDSYMWDVLDADQWRCPREGAIHANVYECGFYSAAWDWSYGAPKQRVRSLCVKRVHLVCG